MAIINFPSKAKERIYKRFPPLGGGEVPQTYEPKEIEYERPSIEQYEVVFWHILLRSIYQEPIDIECELLVSLPLKANPMTAVFRRFENQLKWVNISEETALKIQAGELMPMPVNWKYYIRLSDKGIIEIGTKDNHAVLYFAHVSSDGQIKDEATELAKEFISLLLDEARKETNNKLFDPIKEFQNKDGLKSYMLFNVYRANYMCALFMLKTASTREQEISDEFSDHISNTTNLYDDATRIKHDVFSMTKGMYWSSAIAYFFMALEGFLNILFHAFLKKNLTASGLNIDKKFDIEQKLTLLPVLCDGFLHEQYIDTSHLFSKFRKLKDYRNIIFHSKIEDELNNILFIKDGFFYASDSSRYKEQFLPIQKGNLSFNDVIKVKEIIDEIITMITNSMTDDTKRLTDEYVKESAHIPFYVLKDGSISLGRSESKQNEDSLAQQSHPADPE